MNSETLSRFQQDGFVRIERFFAPEEISEIQANLNRFIAEEVPALPREAAFFEDLNDRSTLKQIQHLEDHDSGFRELFEGRFRDLARQLLGEVVGKNLQYFNKPPGIGQATPPHQDGFYFMLEPCEALTMWLALEDVDEENGCLRYICGSHLDGLRPHSRTKTLGFSQGLTDFPNESDLTNEIICPANAGDLFVHHALTVHRADANRSESRSRRAIGAVFFSAEAKPDLERQAVYQKELTADLVESGKL